MSANPEEVPDFIPIKIKQADVPSLFTAEAVSWIIAQVKEQAVIESPDVSTAKGRKYIASVAAKIARSKVFLDDRGQDLVGDWKRRAKIVDGHRKILRDELDLLKREVRKPLTEWEDAENKREAEIIKNIEIIRKLIIFDSIPTSAEVSDRLVSVRRCQDQADLFQGHEESASFAIAKTLEVLTLKHAEAIKYEAEQAELARLRIESERLAKQVREDEIRREAEDRIRAEQQAEKDRIESERLAAIERAEQAEIREKQAKEQRKKDEALAEARRLEDVIEAERRKSAEIVTEQESKAKEIEIRASNIAHRNYVHDDILTELKTKIANPDEAEGVLQLLVSGQIPHIRVEY